MFWQEWGFLALFLCIMALCVTQIHVGVVARCIRIRAIHVRALLAFPAFPSIRLDMQIISWKKSSEPCGHDVTINHVTVLRPQHRVRLPKSQFVMADRVHAVPATHRQCTLFLLEPAPADPSFDRFQPTDRVFFPSRADFQRSR